MTSSDEVRIRNMVQDDIDAIFQIDKKISIQDRAFTYADMIDSFVGGEVGMSFVAEIGGQVIGFVLASIIYVADQITEICMIQVVGVDPDYRNRGIARKLVAALIENCRSSYIKVVRIMIDQHDSQLQGLFDALEFRRGKMIDYSKSI